MIASSETPTCPGPCPRCGRITTTDELCDTCLVGGRPARKHPERCAHCLNWYCGGRCLPGSSPVPSGLVTTHGAA